MMKLVDDWKNAWRWLSVRIALVGAAVMTGWAGLPNKLQDSLPPWAVSLIAAVVLLGVVVGRLVAQPKIKGEKDDA